MSAYVEDVRIVFDDLADTDEVAALLRAADGFGGLQASVRRRAGGGPLMVEFALDHDGDDEISPGELAILAVLLETIWAKADPAKAAAEVGQKVAEIQSHLSR